MNEKKPSSMMGRAQLEELRALCEANPHIFSKRSSPDAAALCAFDQEFRKLSYVKGLYLFGLLKNAIRLLEKRTVRAPLNVPGFHEPPVSMTPEYGAAVAELREVKRLEREVRFIYRLALVIGSCDDGPDRYLNIEQSENRVAASKALKSAHLAFAELMNDPYFLEHLQLNQVLNDAYNLKGLLAKGHHWVRTSRPEIPFTRARDEENARARHVVNRLVDAGCRIYGWCDAEVISLLTDYHWLAFVAECPDLEETISRTRIYKTERLPLRLDSEEVMRIDLAADTWIPAETYDPPWLDG